MTRPGPGLDPMDLLIVSDLHIGADMPDCPGFQHAEEFLTMVEQTTQRQSHTGRQWRLVLLGDFLDFVATGCSTDAALSAGDRSARMLTHMASTSPHVFDALRQLLALGVPIDVVVGNHDYELMHPRVQDQLASLLQDARAGMAALRFYPWVYFVPGLLYAEHGSQHHDINRVPGLLGQVERLGAGAARTPAAVLARHRQGDCVRQQWPGRLIGAARLAGHLVASLVAAGVADGPANRSRYADCELATYASEVGLPPDLVTRLDRVSTAAPFPLIRRVTRRALTAATRHRGKDDVSDYMLPAARRVHAVLSDAGCDTPFYVFGHTHDARSQPLLPGASTPWYINTGTWSAAVRGRELAAYGRRHPTYIHVVTGDDGIPAARLHRWGLEVAEP